MIRLCLIVMRRLCDDGDERREREREREEGVGGKEVNCVANEMAFSR